MYPTITVWVAYAIAQFEADEQHVCERSIPLIEVESMQSPLFFVKLPFSIS
jgi:hypothetical protein